MPHALGLVLSLIALAAALGTAVAQRGRHVDAITAAVGAGVLVAAGAIGAHAAWRALGALAPTVAFLAALLALAEGCRREGLFEAAGGLIAQRSGGDRRRLLAMVFAVAAATTAVLSLDATVVLLTPVVLATASQLRARPRPYAFACGHLANSASLLLPISNLTNLLAFGASGLSFTRFAELMVLPWLSAIAIEWLVLTRFFSVPPRRGRLATTIVTKRPHIGTEATGRVPRYASLVLALTLAGFAASSALGVAPLWFAIAGALALNAPALLARRQSAVSITRALQPSFLIFVLALAVIVRAAGADGLDAAVRALLPAGRSLPDLLATAALSAALANLLNNLPATLILVPIAAAAGPGSVLAVLIGVNLGPNLTYVGSLATLLWRRVLAARALEISLGEFTVLGLMSAPAAIVFATVLLWLGLRATSSA